MAQHVLQDDHAARSDRQQEKTLDRGRGCFLSGEGFGRTRRGLVWQMRGGVQRFSPASGLGAQMVNGPVVRDAKEPGAKMPDLIEFVRFLDRATKPRR